MSNGLPKVAVVGLGKLGAPLAACFAAKGFQVTGVDVDETRVAAVNEGRAPVYEPGLEGLLKEAKARISATVDIEASVSAAEVTFIVVPTPSDSKGGFSLQHVLPVCESIGSALRDKKEFHLIVLTSTVMPGSTGGQVQRSLEQASRKRCGLEFGLCYSPEFIALGTVIRDFLRPDFVLIGESDSHSGDILERVYRQVCENSPPAVRMNFINAEIAKLAINTFVTTKITFANMLARICERLPDADVDVVTSALGLDSRIGRKYLKGAVGYGGPCFPRDNLALAELGRRVGASAVLAEATDRSNREEVARLASLARSKLPVGGTVGILGLAYKPDTDVVEESQGFLLAKILAAEGISTVAYDPAAMKNVGRALKGTVRLSESLEECVRQADVIVVATPWQSFRDMEPKMLERHSTPRVVIDCWRLLDSTGFSPVVDYIALGQGPRPPIP